jgi:hypothetical protein
VAEDDVAQRPSHLVGDGAAQTAAGGAGLGVLHRGIVESADAACLRAHDGEPADHLGRSNSR